MKKDKKRKKSLKEDVKNSSKKKSTGSAKITTKEKLTGNEKTVAKDKITSNEKIAKEKTVTGTGLAKKPQKNVKAMKALLFDCVNLYQSILELPRSFNSSFLLYPSEIKPLEIIGSTPGINLTQLAKKLDISKSAVSKSTSKLLDKGLVTKERSQASIREVVFLLTPEGEATYQQIGPTEKALYQSLEDVFDSFSSEESAIFDSLLTKINESLEKISKVI